MGWKIVKWVSAGVVAVSSSLVLIMVFDIEGTTWPMWFGVLSALIWSAFLFGIAREEE